MVFNTTINNISVISWLSVLLVEETAVPGENRFNYFFLYLNILVIAKKLKQGRLAMLNLLFLS
jgi:hypothetical protein